jgi:hypothetical protein
MMKLPALALVLGTALSGCASVLGDDPQQLVLTPAPELEAATLEAAQAWSDATGLDVTVGPGGIPVVVDDALQAGGNAPDEGACGRTYVRRLATGKLVDVRQIAVRLTAPAGYHCRTPAGTLRHEIAHALRSLGSPDVDPGAGHADEGLFAERANDSSTIDADALAAVCETAACAWMQEEGL